MTAHVTLQLKIAIFNYVHYSLFARKVDTTD